MRRRFDGSRLSSPSEQIDASHSSAAAKKKKKKKK
jgi:hypothetical protein